jgi:hypothetical protein
VDIDLQDIISGLTPPSSRVLHKSHSLPPRLGNSDLPEWLRLVTVIRDPRDVVVSAAFYLANLPEEKGGWGKEFAELPVGGRIVRILENGGWIRTRLREWHRCQHVHRICYETLLNDTPAEMQRLLSFLDIKVEEVEIRNVCARHAFEKRSGRKPGVEDEAAFLRKGVSGDWRNYFDDEVRHVFDNVCSGDWNDLLIELGYETHSRWQ